MTIACEDRDFAEWHRGIPHAYLWGCLAPVDLVLARKALGKLLLPRYDRDPHVTVVYCGLAGSEFNDARLADDLTRLLPLCKGPIQVRPARWGSFRPSPMLEVESRWLSRAHKALSVGLLERIPIPYRPHVTVGFYAVEVPIDIPLARLSTVPLPNSWTIGTLQLLRYETHDISGPLTVIGELSLTTGRYTER